MRADGELNEVKPPDCSVCHLSACSTPGAAGPITGGQFIAASMGLFLVPILLAIAGAMLAGGEPHYQFAGAVVGLGIGMGGAIAVGRWVSRNSGEEIPKE